MYGQIVCVEPSTSVLVTVTCKLVPICPTCKVNVGPSPRAVGVGDCSRV